MEPRRTNRPIAALERPLGITVLVPVLTLATLWGVWVALFRPEQFRSTFPGVTTPLLAAYLLYAAMMLAGLGGLWFLRRWSVPLLVTAIPLGTLFDLNAHAPQVRLIAGWVVLALLFAVTRPLWRRWWPRRGASSG